ncbi:MAG: DUF928 domain-containing protein [Oscillatoriophycideae cyanobacterium NC_groundwater_1537_Pr4_S-0.65um_50_18]|nr:DUF928 domain-containing protein [Oscillatoriophycideae cyanobacterium NC_groundwater_1537_Pr4_S-0.65um_50_18]
MTHLKQVPLAIALWVALSGSFQGQAQAVPTLPNANDPIVFNAPPPPSTGRPGRRADAGSRGCSGDETNASELTLTALVPTQVTASSTVVFGKTAAERPTFWFYVPYRSSSTATFVLQDQDGNSIYQSDMVLPETAGILSVTLPATSAPLEAGKLYHWFFKLYCRSTSPPDSFVDGWIQRESLPSDLTQQLKTATLPQQVRLYAAQGLWFEALSTAAEQRRANSGDSAWAELLRAIGLESVAGEAIVIP